MISKENRETTLRSINSPSATISLVEKLPWKSFFWLTLSVCREAVLMEKVAYRMEFNKLLTEFSKKNEHNPVSLTII